MTNFLENLPLRHDAGFIQMTYPAINLPELWSYEDQKRSHVENWAIGKTLDAGTPCIGRLGLTFVSDEDAHDWVAKRARGTNIYARALAVIAALTVRG